MKMVKWYMYVLLVQCSLEGIMISKKVCVFL